MTSTEPMTYKPGPELDAQLCRLFGWPYYISAIGKECVYESPGEEECSECDQSLSQSWRGMRLVIEEMQRRDWWMMIDQTGASWYAANFWNWKTAENSRRVHAESAPHAVCLAALSALQHVSHTDGLGDRDD